MNIVLEWIKDYGPGVAAIIIATSSIFTAWILRRSSNPKGWLKVQPLGMLRIRQEWVLYSRDSSVADHGQAGQYLYVNIINTGIFPAQIIAVEYHVRSRGWRLGRQASDEVYERPEWDYADPSIPTVYIAPHRALATPFDIGPQQWRRWEQGVGRTMPGPDGTVIPGDQLHEVTCVRVSTASGEKIHARLIDARHPMVFYRCWRSICCKFGVHK